MKKLGLIGKNISYSFSRGYFAEKFQRESRTDWHYENIDIQSVEDAQKHLDNNEFIGFNVTIPYKEAIIPLLDALSPEAQQIGAVNTLVRQEQQWIGHNTDWIGFWQSLKNQCTTLPKNALILGNGGASKAIVFALKNNNIKTTIVARNPKNLQEIPWENLSNPLIQTHDLIVNTTPVGTYPNIQNAPKIPYEAITKHHILFDLIYNPQQTTFLKNGKDQGAKTINGHEMLIHQAEEAFRLWNQQK